MIKKDAIINQTLQKKSVDNHLLPTDYQAVRTQCEQQKSDFRSSC